MKIYDYVVSQKAPFGEAPTVVACGNVIADSDEMATALVAIEEGIDPKSHSIFIRAWLDQNSPRTVDVWMG